MEEAIQAVEKAESYRNAYFIGKAQEKVSQLPDGEQKEILLSRLSKLAK